MITAQEYLTMRDAQYNQHDTYPGFSDDILDARYAEPEHNQPPPLWCLLYIGFGAIIIWGGLIAIVWLANTLIGGG